MFKHLPLKGAFYGSSAPIIDLDDFYECLESFPGVNKGERFYNVVDRDYNPTVYYRQGADVNEEGTAGYTHIDFFENNTNYFKRGLTKIQKIYNLLSRYKFSVNNEKTTQVEIQQKLTEHKIVHAREYFLDEDNIPDFMVDDVAIEVKINGNKRDIYAQILRYSKFDEVKSVLLVTNKSIGHAPLYEGKKLMILNIGRAHL